MTNRLCLHCNKPLARRDHEGNSNFLRRRFCDRRCAGRHAGRELSIKATQQRKRQRRRTKQEPLPVMQSSRQGASLRSGEVETIDAYLARGGSITRCPSAYAAPVEHAMAEFAGTGRRVRG